MPNRAWEKGKFEFLNNARVRRAIVQIGWSEQWEMWLQLHELNAGRAFDVKVTKGIMRSASSAMASTFKI